jgi:hypothetical protein
MESESLLCIEIVLSLLIWTCMDSPSCCYKVRREEERISSQKISNYCRPFSSRYTKNLLKPGQDLRGAEGDAVCSGHG